MALNAQAQDQWVATWATPPQAPRAVFPSATHGAPPPDPTLKNQTVRMIAHTSIGGRRAVVHLSNAYGTGPLRIGAAHIALRDKESAIVATSDRALTFGGKASFTIPPGAEIVSDPVDLNVPKLGDLVVSVYVPGEETAPTTHLTALHTSYVSKGGDQTAAPAFTDATTRASWYWLSEIDVLAAPKSALIVALGDSITNGVTSTPDMDQSWPSHLARRLAANKATAKLAIVNQGIPGSALLADSPGGSVLTRFDRDVLDQPGVAWVIVLAGVNDIGLAAFGDPQVTADDVIAADKQIIDRAHMHGIKVMGATLTPFSGHPYFSDANEVIRQAVNQWIRTGKAFDAVVDFDAAVRDPDDPKKLRPAYNIRDHLHPNDVGYKAMADAVDLSIFTAR